MTSKNRVLRRIWPGNRLLALASGLALLVLPVADSFAAEDLDERLRHRIEVAALHDQDVPIGNGTLPGQEAVKGFYERRFFQPAWVREDGSVPHGRALLDAIRDGRAHGMEPNDYPLAALEGMLEDAESGDATTLMLLDLELLLTGTYLLYGSHSLSGRLNPDDIDPDWRIRRRVGDLMASLESAVASGEIADNLQALLPQSDRYQGLRNALAHYRAIDEAGGFIEVDAGPTLRPGDRAERVAALRGRLQQSNDLPGDLEPPDDPTLYDERLAQGVRAFQRRHGLDVDAVVGPRTREALNVSAEDRVRQMLVNMERWRWLPEDLGERYILVNIAGFSMEVVREGEVVTTQRVIVGRDYRQTPVFAGRMTYLVLNPSWEVPNSIATRDILPQVRNDPAYLERMGFQVLQGWGAAQREIDAQSVDWQTVSARGFPYRFRQRPGPLNALGQVKFMFPNQYAVYLHDTPARDLFDRTERAFSSGCIRVERPMELTRLVLDDARWDNAAISRVLDERRERTVTLARPWSVYLQYMTAWVDDDGVVNLRRDLYDRDTRVANALESAPPQFAAAD